MAPFKDSSQNEPEEVPSTATSSVDLTSRQPETVEESAAPVVQAMKAETENTTSGSGPAFPLKQIYTNKQAPHHHQANETGKSCSPQVDATYGFLYKLPLPKPMAARGATQSSDHP